MCGRWRRATDSAASTPASKRNVFAIQARILHRLGAHARRHSGMGGVRPSARETQIALRADDCNTREQAGLVQLSRESEASGGDAGAVAQADQSGASRCKTSPTHRGEFTESTAHAAVRMAAGAEGGIAGGLEIAESAGNPHAGSRAASRAQTQTESIRAA